jgi:CheY-like chemotaxis protein
MCCPTLPVIGILNSSPALVRLLERACALEGYLTAAAVLSQFPGGALEVAAFLRRHDPRVVVYDLAPPYRANWDQLQQVRQFDQDDTRQFIVTTTNRRALEAQLGPVAVVAIIRKPFDVRAVLAAVARALSGLTPPL